jgi:hypothetical protein
MKEFFQRLFGGLFGAKPGATRVLRVGGRPKRRVAVIGPDARVAAELVGRLFDAQRDGHHPLQPASGDVRSLDLAALPADPFAATYKRTFRGADAVQTWEICVPRSFEVRPNDPASWKYTADTIVVVWPYVWLGRPAQELHDAVFQLTVALGHARQQGRLARVAFVIGDLPESAAPATREQARLDWPRGSELRSGVRAELERARDHCGDPLADPRWRSFVSSAVLGTDDMAGLVNHALALVGRRCAMFFSGQDRPSHFDDLLAWIRRPAPATPPARTPRLVAAVAGAWCALMILAALLVPGPSATAPPAWPDSPGIYRTIQTRLHDYDRWLGVPDAVASTGGHRALLELDTSLADMFDLLRREQRVIAATRAARQDADGMTPEQRRQRGRELLRVANEELQNRRIWLAHHDAGAYVAEELTRLDAALAQASFQAALLCLTPRDQGFAGWALPADVHDAATRSLTTDLRADSLAGVIEQLVDAASAAAFYRDVWTRGALGAHPNWAPADSALPRMRLQHPEVAQNGPNLTRWRDLCAALGTPMFLRYVFGAVEDKARIDGLARDPNRAMTITFSTTGHGAQWHIDASAPGSGFVAARALPTPPSPDGGCRVELPRVRQGSAVTLFLNRTAKNHVNPGGALRPCGGSVALGLVLLAPEGNLTFPGGFVVHYVVTEGWDAGAVAAAQTGVHP